MTSMTNVMRIRSECYNATLKKTMISYERKGKRNPAEMTGIPIDTDLLLLIAKALSLLPW